MEEKEELIKIEHYFRMELSKVSFEIDVIQRRKWKNDDLI